MNESSQPWPAFDDEVIRAMAKWPDVPQCFGWLSLDVRGRWRIQGELIAHTRAQAFLSRHYRADEQGRWYVQNGPQQVFVALDYTPWIYRWQPQAELFASIDDWWRRNAEAGRASLILGYSFGKAQRILRGVDRSIGPIFVHGAVEPLNRAYRAAGVDLPETPLVTEVNDKSLFRRALIVAPPSVQGSVWTRRFGEHGDAFASGWMQLRGARRRRSVDRGFVLSDHADWPGLQRAIRETGAERVIVTHGYEAVMVRWLTGQGLEASAFETEYGDNDDEDPHPGPLP